MFIIDKSYDSAFSYKKNIKSIVKNVLDNIFFNSLYILQALLLMSQVEYRNDKFFVNIPTTKALILYLKLKTRVIDFIINFICLRTYSEQHFVLKRKHFQHVLFNVHNTNLVMVSKPPYIGTHVFIM